MKISKQQMRKKQIICDLSENITQSNDYLVIRHKETDIERNE